ncbi:hypothetical protein EJB05_14255, partial [Eragrostis curvula]
MANPGLTDGERAMTPPPPPQLVEDTIAEILLCVQPDEPADLVRASLVSKPWRRILTDAAFLRRYREFHRAPPLLGFFHNGHSPRFVPATTTAASPVPQPEFGSNEWWALDCHHGRVLLDLGYHGNDLLVWDPITGDQHRLQRPGGGCLYFAAAVLCAVPSCNHLNCHGGPFVVIYMGFHRMFQRIIQVFVYSSETGVWAESASIYSGMGYEANDARNVALIGDELYFTLPQCVGILKYELGKDCLSVFDPPDMCGKHASLFQMEDGSLGLTSISGSSLHLWSRNVNPEGVVGWVQCRIIELEEILPIHDNCNRASIIGSAEDVGVTFVSTDLGVFTVDLKSGCRRGG